MSKEQINLSDALDLIAQSKGDIKTSVQGKGGIIGDDLTEYNTAIDNIKFRTLSFTKNSISINPWGSGLVDMTQYLDGVNSMPDEFTYAMTRVSGADPNANVAMSEISGAKRFIITPVDYGTSTLNIHDNMGNCDYPISVAVNTTDLDSLPFDYAGFTFFGDPRDDTDHPVGGPDDPTGDFVADWDSTAQSFYADFTIHTADGYAVPYTDVNVVVAGEMIDNNLITVTVGAIQGYANMFRMTFTPATDPMTGDPVQYNGIIEFLVTDGQGYDDTSGHSWITRTICFREGTDYVEPASGFTYDGSDENSPIQVNVDLADYPADEIINTFPEVNINFSAPSNDYDWNYSDTWTCNTSVDELYSNDNDCMLYNMTMQMDGYWTLGNGGYGYTGPRSVGTHLKSYTLTFHYDSSLSMKTDETTGEPTDDPVAQALDGTDVTFYVEYNVTDSGASE